MGLFWDKVKSAAGAFRIEGNGFYFPAKIRGESVFVSQIVTTSSSVKISLPITYNNLAILYNFESNGHAPEDVVSIEIPSGISLVNFEYLANIPHVKINGDINSVDEAFEKLNPEKCVLEICNNRNYSTCNDGRSIINKQGALMYYGYLGDDVLKIAEGVRSIGRNCLPKGKSFNLPASFDFGLDKDYETKSLFNRFCELAENYKVKRIQTAENNPFWQYDNVFLHDKRNNTFFGYISDNIEVLHLAGQTYPHSFRKHNFERIKRVDLAKDYSINLMDTRQIANAISSLRFVLGLFPNLEDVSIDNANLDWVNKSGLIIHKKSKLVVFVLPNVKNAFCPDGIRFLKYEMLKNCIEIRFSDLEHFNLNTSDPMFLKNVSNQLNQLPNLKKVQVSQQNKDCGIIGNFLINNKQECAFHPLGNIEKDIIIPSKKLIFWQGLVSNFRLRARKSYRPYYSPGYDLNGLSKYSQKYPQVEQLVFPPEFDFPGLLNQQDIANEDLELLNTITEKELFPPVGTVSPGAVDKQQEYIDCLLILIIKQFCNLRTIIFGSNEFYENRNGMIINKKTKKILIILPEAEKVIIPPDLWMDEPTVFGLSSNRSLSVFFPFEKYKDSSWIGYHLSSKHTYYVPVQWLLNNQNLRSRGNLVGYDRFGIVPKEESKSSVYRVRKRAQEPQKQLPFEGMNRDYYIRDVSVKNNAQEINEGDTICCKLNSVVSVMNTFPCINKGHQMVRVFLEVLIKKTTEKKPFKKKLEAYYCKQCKRIFMYTTEYNLIRGYTTGYGYHVFNRFSINGHNEGYSDSPATWANESILKEAGYEVNQNSSLNQKERLDILIELNRRGVPYHTIISYINVFINVIGASWSKDMTQPVERWESDLEAVRELYFKGILN